MNLIFQLRYSIPKKDFRNGLIDLVFKWVKNDKEVENCKYVQKSKNTLESFKRNNYLKALIINGDPSEISYYEYCSYLNLNFINIPSSVKYIGTGAFTECKYLKKIIIPEGVTHILDSTFSHCYRLEEVKIPKSVAIINTCAFYLCRYLTRLEIPFGVKIIGEKSFGHCYNLKHVVISLSVKSISPRAFYMCKKIETITIPKRFQSQIKEIFNNIDINNVEITYIQKCKQR